MTQRDSGSPSFDPKHRIIGAVVIVVLAVILLPLILKEREPSPTPGGTGTPPPAVTETSAGGNKVAVTVVTPPVQMNPKPAPTPPPPMTAPAVSAPVVGAVAPSTSESTRVEPVSTPSSSKPVTASKPIAPAASKAATNGWVVQVGTFASTTNAARVQDKLRSMGQTVQAEQVTLQGGDAVRVRVGPFRDRNAALKAQDQIQKETGMKVVVLAFP